MGAGHCPWGGYTDRNVCNIHGGYASHRAMLRPNTFSGIGTLPAKLAPCHYSRTILEKAPCRPTTFGKMPNIVGTLPKVPHLTLIVHNWPHTSLLWPKLAQKRHIFVDNWPWPLTFDLGSQKISLSRMTPIFMPNMEAVGQTVLPFFGAETCTNMTYMKQTWNIYGWSC